MRRLPLAIGFLILTVTLSAQSKEQLFDQGLGAFQDGLYDDALGNFDTYLERYGSESRADAVMYMAGVARYSLGRYAESLETFGRLGRERPESPYLRRSPYWQGLSHYALGQWDRAEESFTGQLAHQGETYYVERSFLYLGLLKEKKADWDGAAESYARLISLSGNTELVTQAYYRRGLVYLNREDYLRALPNFETLSADYGSSPYTKAMPYYIGLCYLNLDKPEEAKRRFELYLRLFPAGEYADSVRLQLARAESEAGNRDKALELLENLQASGGDLAGRARNMMAENYSALGNTARAREIWLALLEEETRPGEKDRIKYNIALTWLKEGNTDKAAARFKETMALLDSPVRRDSLDALASLYLEEGDKELALGYAKTLFDDYPDYEKREEAGALAAALMMELNRTDMLGPHLKLMVDLYGDGEKNDLYLMMLGQAAMDRKEWTDALSYLGRLEKNYPQSEYREEALYRLGYIYILREEYIRGAEYLEKLLALNKELSPEVEEDARYSLALANYKGGKGGEALSLFEDYLARYGETERGGEIALYMGDIRFDRREWSRAADLFSMSAGVLGQGESPLVWEASFKEALSRQKMEAWEPAAGLFLALADQAPLQPYGEESLYQGGVCLVESGQSAQGRELFERAVREASGDVRERSLYQLVRLSLAEGDREEAVRLAEVMKADYPESGLGSSLFFSEAEDYWTMGDYEQAREWYLLCARVFPEPSVEIQAGLRASLALAESGRTAEAIDELSRDLTDELKSGGGSPEGRATALGRLLVKEKQPALAEKILTEVSALTDKPAVLGPLVIASERSGSADGNMPAYLERIYRSEDLPLSLRTEALLLLGRYRIADGERNEGKALYRVVMDSDKGSLGAEANYLLGELISEDDPSQGAQELLNVSYNYPDQADWASRALYRSWELYSAQEGAEKRAQIVRDKLLEQYPDSEWALMLGE